MNAYVIFTFEKINPYRELKPASWMNMDSINMAENGVFGLEKKA